MSSKSFRLPALFQKSYLERDEYPINIIQRSVNTYYDALNMYKEKLDDAEEAVFESNEHANDVSFRDFYGDDGNGRALEKHNICGSQELRQWLGVEINPNVSDGERALVTVKCKDPKSRFIYFYGGHSRMRLKVTRAMLSEILTFHQVMPEYLDFILAFGQHNWSSLLKFSSFREQTALTATTYEVPGLARSGKQFQLCYNLKGVKNRKSGSGEAWWSIHEAGFYHRFDIAGGNTLWVVTKGGVDIQLLYQAETGTVDRAKPNSFGTPEECFQSSLSGHLLFCYWSARDWRRYIEYLDRRLENESVSALFNRSVEESKVYSGHDVESLQSFEDLIDDAIAVLKGNVDVMTSLKDYYASLLTNKDFPLAQTCKSDIGVFVNTLKGVMGEFIMEMNYANRLLKKASNRKELVNKHIDRQAAERVERMNKNMEKEAVVVRIITVVTLIYLPATFVSTMFSTDIIKFQGQSSDGGTFSYTAMVRWLQVTLPLTFATLLLSWLGSKWAERRKIQC